MILHLVLFRLKSGVAPDDPRYLTVRSAMERLPDKIPEIRLWQHGGHMLTGGAADPLAWDYGLLAGFDDEAALLRYFDHPDHVPVVAAWEQISELVYADFPAGALPFN